MSATKPIVIEASRAAVTPSSPESPGGLKPGAPPASIQQSPSTRPETAAGAPRAAGPQAAQRIMPLAGYLLAFGGMLLLASSAVGLIRQRPASW